MVKRSYKLEEIVAKLRQVDVLHSQGQGMTIADAVREIGVSEVTFYRWRKDYGGMKADQLKRIKELEKAEVAPSIYLPGSEARRKRASTSTVQGAISPVFDYSSYLPGSEARRKRASTSTVQGAVSPFS